MRNFWLDDEIFSLVMWLNERGIFEREEEGDE